MGLEKAIQSGKEKRKAYYGSKSFDCSCRNHGDCSWCQSNRHYAIQKKKDSANQQLKEFQTQGNYR